MKKGLYEKFFKRLLDIILSFLAIILLSPIILMVSILVYFKLGSPVFFTQERPGKDENGNPTILLAQVKRKGGRKVLTDHAWIKYNRELVKAGTLVYNDVIEFDATIEEYEHEGKFSKYMEYGLTDIKNVQIVKAVKIPKNHIHIRSVIRLIF